MIRFAILLTALFLFSGCGGGGGTGSDNLSKTPGPLLMVDMHNGVMCGTGYSSSEAGGYVATLTTADVTAGSVILPVSSTDGFVTGQLVVLENNDHRYRTGVVSSVAVKAIILSKPVFNNISANRQLCNFYENHFHPNEYGYFSIADYAVGVIGADKLNHGVHVLFGDSWFDNPYMEHRIKSLLPAATIINRGIGGQTVSALLERLDKDVAPLHPDFVWVICGTNDYAMLIPAATYASKMQTLVDRIRAIGAVPVILGPSVGPVVETGFGVGNLYSLSQEYAAQMQFIK